MILCVAFSDLAKFKFLFMNLFKAILSNVAARKEPDSNFHGGGIIRWSNTDGREKRYS